MVLRFGFRPCTVDVLYVVVNTTAFVFGSVGHHDVIGLAQQDFRVELLALTDGAADHLLTPAPRRLRLRAKLIRDIGVNLAVFLLAFVLDNELLAVIGAVGARRHLYVL
jgi:hypothetical protein